MIRFQDTPQLTAAAVLVLINEQQIEDSKLIDSSVRSLIEPLIKKKKFSGARDELLPIFHKDSLIVFSGIGTAKEHNYSSLRILIKETLSHSYFSKASSIEILPHSQEEADIIAILEGVCIGLYRFHKYLNKKASGFNLQKTPVTITASDKKIYTQVVETALGVNMARDWVNENADVANSDYLEKCIRQICKGNKNVVLTVLGKKDLEKHGLNMHLAVNQGSPNEPKLIIARYNGGKQKEKYTALVGKGLTFDTGGLNLKPTGNIETMRLDMGGAAAVIATLRNVVKLKPKKNILFAVGLAENVTGSKSYKPGDILTSYAGITVEVGNTDAEGRLVLGDAIAYIVKNYKPKHIIDVATLTGACIIALGHDYTGLVSTDDELAKKLLQSAAQTDDRAWRLPIYPELQDSLKSQFADIKNLGFSKGIAGTITAAEFLRRFTNNTSWAHLDIAGTSFVEGNQRLYFNHGATGSGVRLLTHYLVSNS